MQSICIKERISLDYGPLDSLDHCHFRLSTFVEVEAYLIIASPNSWASQELLIGYSLA